MLAGIWRQRWNCQVFVFQLSTLGGWSSWRSTRHPFEASCTISHAEWPPASLSALSTYPLGSFNYFVNINSHRPFYLPWSWVSQGIYSRWRALKFPKILGGRVSLIVLGRLMQQLLSNAQVNNTCANNHPHHMSLVSANVKYPSPPTFYKFFLPDLRGWSVPRSYLNLSIVIVLYGLCIGPWTQFLDVWWTIAPSGPTTIKSPIFQPYSCYTLCSPFVDHHGAMIFTQPIRKPWPPWIFSPTSITSLACWISHLQQPSLPLSLITNPKSCIFFRLYGVHGRLSFFLRSSQFLCCPRLALSTTLGWGSTTSMPANDGHGDDSNFIITQMWHIPSLSSSRTSLSNLGLVDKWIFSWHVAVGMFMEWMLQHHF